MRNRLRSSIFTGALAATAIAAFPVTAGAATVLSEAFNYADGPLVGATASPWATHSGTTTQIDVASGAATITGSESEDINAPLAGAPYSAGIVTATFDVTFSALPTGTTYFAHFYSTSSIFRAKLFSTVTGADAGTLRLGITNNANTGTFVLPTNLTLGQTYSVSLSYDIENVITSLSIDGGTAISASDSVSGTPAAINAFAFRQSGGIGTMTVDNLLVNQVPEPAAALLGSIGLLGLLRRRRA